jgi:transcription-repair coupling factor (superfamily II helicase)
MALIVAKDTLPTQAGGRITVNNLKGAALALAIAELAHTYSGIVVVLATDPSLAAKLTQEVAFFIGEDTIPILQFPDWEILSYDTFSPHQDIVSERLTTLYRLPDLKKGVLIVPMTTLMHRLCPKTYLFQNTLLLKMGDNLSLETLRARLAQSSYLHVPQVMTHGEFSIRGSLLDLFPMGSETPFRIDLFDNEIETIRTFEVETQRSKEMVSEIRLLPAREFPLNQESISAFRTRWRDHFEGEPRQSQIYLDVSEGRASLGLEYYLPLFFGEMGTLFDYLPAQSLILRIEDVEKTANSFWREIKDRYEQYRHDRIKPILEPKMLFLEPQEVFAEIKKFPQVKLSSLDTDAETDFALSKQIELLPDIAIEARQEKPLKKFEEFVEDFKGPILLCVESAARKESIKELLKGIQYVPKDIVSWQEFITQTKISSVSNASKKLNIIIGPLEEGMLLTANFALITETELIGRKRIIQRRRRKNNALEIERDMEIRSLAELNLGAPVVHSEYGVGRYLGLTHLTLSGLEAEFVTLEYAGGDKLYVPVSALNLISRYSGADLDNAPLHRLGSAEWQRARQKVLEEARDVAAELLEIYAEREAKVGFSFPKPDTQFEAFSAEFPFEETPDQARAINEVIQDMLAPKPMDRVVCGDVGFGKTEVAVRAAFLAVAGGKQVAILVPTTLLAEQHFETFSNRFAGFPIKVDVLSRFKNKKQQTVAVEAIKAGKIDILIGTHKILQENIKFKNLGLLIIDEEHRFGVRQKEAFKAFRKEVDILTLTATPIPRTLNMAMSGIRDLSIIATPPAKRLSIKTFVRERSNALIQEAILRELHRGGQVYFVHNAVDTIENEARFLETLIPIAKVGVAHGQMHERELERVMSDFYHRRFNVLVCTTIIETGIDIPTANTIILDRADKFGLAQLHQLRGRVGRSHHQAYAFCLLPARAKVTADAQKRLEALSNLEELGAGFMLATHDLEIRGAGELLGDSQSGNIQTVGFSLYMELLNEAVKTLKAGGELNTDFSVKKGPEIDLQIPTLIPMTYIPDVHTRLVLYKRISKTKTMEALKELSVEMIDRFGAIPKQTDYLFKVTELKFLAENLGILKIDAGPKGGRLEFSTKPNINPNKIIELIQKKSHHYKMDGPQKLRFLFDLSDCDKRIEVVKELLARLS